MHIKIFISKTWIHVYFNSWRELCQLFIRQMNYIIMSFKFDQREVKDIFKSISLISWNHNSSSNTVSFFALILKFRSNASSSISLEISRSIKSRDINWIFFYCLIRSYIYFSWCWLETSKSIGEYLVLIWVWLLVSIQIKLK